jgi:carbon storage regulator
MLVLSRKRGERVYIGGGIVVLVAEIKGDRVQLGFDCPPQVAVHREEVYHRICREHQAEVLSGPPGKSHCRAEFA